MGHSIFKEDSSAALLKSEASSSDRSQILLSAIEATALLALLHEIDSTSISAVRITACSSSPILEEMTCGVVLSLSFVKNLSRLLWYKSRNSFPVSCGKSLPHLLTIRSFMALISGQGILDKYVRIFAATDGTESTFTFRATSSLHNSFAL